MNYNNDYFKQLLSMKFRFLSFTFLLVNLLVIAQDKGSVIGHVLSKGEPVPFAGVILKNTTTGTSTDENGNFSINLPEGKQTLVVQMIGYKTQEKTINVPKNGKVHLDFNLEESVFGLDDVVVTATKGLQKRTEAPVIVTVTTSATMQKAQAISLSEGLSFQPGLRMENNCQNCGFSQVRMNGLDGAYSQILIDSKPVFSALNGVYGLDQIPTNMIERIEVVRGGGSSLFGANAIAGTINIITKEPVKNGFEVNTNFALIDGKASDNALTLNATALNTNKTLGIQVFGMKRDRKPYDANGDEFSEITKIQNTTIGFKTFFKPFERAKITVDFNAINEFRRGGGMNMSLKPFESFITEQIESKVLGGGINFDYFSKDLNQKFNFYANAQKSNNENFYGGRQDDEFGNIDLVESLRGFGQTEVKTVLLGAQYSKKMDSFLGGSGNFLTGVEYRNEDMNDEKPGFNAFIRQELNIFGFFAQQEWRALPKLKILAGIRGDLLNSNLTNATNGKVIVNPRLNVLYDVTENLQWRTSYAKGFRAPQVFSEDIHARIAAGEVALIFLAEDLKAETSHSFLTSLDYSKINPNSEIGLTFETFYTRLKDPFILEQLENEFNWEKRNGKGADVYGINLEAKYAPGQYWQMQGGATFQKSVFDEAVQWSDNIENTNKNFFRAPNVYGNMMITYAPNKKFQNNLTYVYTGSMNVQHVAGFIDEDRVLKTNPFHEINLKTSYTFELKSDVQLQLNAGIQNVFNNYQSDFDSGVNRDGSFVYGPTRPRTFFVGLKIGTDLL
jgi:outer membrane receptor for ferrienterochelin and colicins